MSTRPIKAVILPAHLSRNSPMNLPEQSPRYVNPDFIYMDEDTGGLFLYKDDRYPSSSKNPKAILGKVAVMRVSFIDQERNETTGELKDKMTCGFVADLRFIESANDFGDAPTDEVPDDQEDFNRWQKDREDAIPIAAVGYEGTTAGEVATAGDSRFVWAVLHLAELADQFNARLLAEDEGKEMPKKTKSKSGKTEDEDQIQKGLSVDK